MSRSFLDANIEDLVDEMTPGELSSLLSAPNWWNTTAVPRLDVPSVRMSDGPNGVRGSSHFIPTPAQCIPCATSMASTFDTELINRVGKFLASEAKVKSSVILLAPTCNIQRNPLGGRAFESFSEDPHLSGTLAAAYVNGLQDAGVSATIKHFTANDQEDERTASNSVMSDRALREIYLMPFMLAQKHAQPWAYMTSYGRINNVHCSENKDLLQGILRDEWKFDGIVMSDWFGTYSVEGAINAGMDLEMPGPPRIRTPLYVANALASQKITPATIKERATAMLTWAQKLARLNPDVVYGDGVEGSQDSEESRKFCREIAAAGIVVLKNEADILPIKTKNILVVGPNAKGTVISGGGSAALKPTYVVTPYAGLADNAPDSVKVDYHVGCYAHKYLPTLEKQLKTASGEVGWTCSFYNHDEQDNRTFVADCTLNDTRVRLNDQLPQGLVAPWTMTITGDLTVEHTGQFELGLAVAGRAKLFVDDQLCIDNWTSQTPGEFFYGQVRILAHAQGTIEEKNTIDVVAGKSVRVRVEFSKESAFNYSGSNKGGGTFQPELMKGVRLGGVPKVDEDAIFNEAVTLASKADTVVFIGGLTPEWESEGFDRDTLSLPGRQDELIAAIAAANHNTTVVLQVGSAVAMPWIDSVRGVVQAWYLGNESGNAISDVLYGRMNPSGRLPLSLPRRKEDIAAFPQLKCEYGNILYGEDLYVGYKHFNTRGIKPLFPFGFGLSYTTFSFSNLQIKQTPSRGAEEFQVEVSVTIKNEGTREGSEVAQLYIDMPDAGHNTPRQQLKAFGKAQDIQPGQTKSVTMKLDKYAVSSWDPRRNVWVALKGEYKLYVGPNSVELPLSGAIEVKREFTWKGL
ncbi:glycoside hydrolase family 3 protein [Pterulicium gracile]|uniref:beta-glucosidase n=1 Tax=Pterulicium gracile TaxID=1884261 RepID=A0A5C3QPX8_9AGAR|nr:glycoside hydrolase family 3 protein [Pterula gracilis]